MLSLFLALLPQSPSAINADETVLRLTTTGAAVKLALPGLAVEPKQVAGLKRRFGDRGVLSGKLRGGDGNVTVIAAYGSVHTSKEWREVLMSGKLVGAGQFDIGGTACTEQVRDLEPPYADLTWHAFLTMADTTFDLLLNTLSKDGQPPFKRAEFEHLVAGARYAVVRMGNWEDMPIPVLDRMHEGLSLAGGDGPAHLVELAKTAPDGWACALAAAEIGRPHGMAARDRLALYDRVLADIKKLEAPTKFETFAQLTALSGRAIALRDDGQLAPAMAEIAKAREMPAGSTTAAKAVLSYDAATIQAQQKDATAAVASLREAIALDPDRRAFATHENAFEPIGSDKALILLLKTGK